MTTTPELIATLAADATPVRRLRHPLVRASSWLLLAVFVVALLAISQGLRPDLAQRLEQPTFVIGVAAALLTGVLAAIASCLVSLPDRSRLWSLLPVPTLLLWLSTIGYGCLTSWIGLGPDGMRPSEVARCFATLLLTSVPLSVAMLVMLRHAAPRSATLSTADRRGRQLGGGGHHRLRGVVVPRSGCDSNDSGVELRYSCPRRRDVRCSGSKGVFLD
jgi:hypothetical protein